MHKYYSRSPEEFREYAESFNKGRRKKNWIQILILVDIVILVFIFFMTTKTMNSDLGPIRSSTKARTEGLELYFIKSSDSNKENITYFLFVKNMNMETYTFPKPEVIIKFFLKTTTGINCYTKEIKFNPKTIVKDSTEFYAFNISSSELSLLPDKCQKILIREEGIKGYRKMFAGGKSNVDAILEFQDKENRQTLVIKNERWY
ncbi:MAG: hypothetical protein H7A23_06595 [Leptospiraceae bacterium]|nr:hypothetical protein [Leptospiraceae bacterium]MCP5494208.1 hypothetical protein [Leptospiraceae bacterium]